MAVSRGDRVDRGVQGHPCLPAQVISKGKEQKHELSPDFVMFYIDELHDLKKFLFSPQAVS